MPLMTCTETWFKGFVACEIVSEFCNCQESLVIKLNNTWYQGMHLIRWETETLRPPVQLGQWV